VLKSDIPQIDWKMFQSTTSLRYRQECPVPKSDIALLLIWKCFNPISYCCT